MKSLFCVFALAVTLGVIGCGKKEAGSPSVTPVKPATGSMPSLSQMAEPPPPPVVAVPAPPGTPLPPGAATAASDASSSGQANGLVAAVDSDGQVLPGEAMIQKAIEIYVEGLGKSWPKDLNELVQAKVLRAIPPAPPGKKWALDGKQYKVLLTNQ